MASQIRVGLVSALILTILGVSAASGYVLRDPHREHCRPHYVRKIAHRKVECIRRAAPQLQPGTMEWLLARAPVAHVHEVFVAHATPFFAEIHEEKERWLASERWGGRPAQGAQWIQGEPSCRTGEYTEHYGAFALNSGDRKIPYIVCRQELELKYQVPHEEGEYINGEWTKPTVTYREESHQWRMNLEVTEGPTLCGNLTAEEKLFNGASWASLGASGSVCNVTV